MNALIISPAWVGDTVMSHSLYRTLKVRHGDAQLEVLAPAMCCPLLSRMPEVHRTIPLCLGHGQLALFERYRIGQMLRMRGYTHAFVLPNSFKSALIPFFARIPVRIGWRGEMRYGVLNDMRVMNESIFPQMVQRYVALAYHRAEPLSPVLWPQLSVQKKEIQCITRQFDIDQRPLIGLCPGAAFGPAKCWPMNHYATLANMLVDQGYDVVVFGSEQEKTLGHSICAQLPQFCHNLAGKTTLDQAVVLLAACQAIVTNDSGLMHIAAALNKPLVALYGPTSPDFTPPLTAQSTILRLATGGHQKVRMGNAPGGYHDSLVKLQPVVVLTAVLEALEKPRSNTAH